MHRTGSGAWIFGIDAGLVGGRFCSLFFRFDISCALTLVPLIQNQCAGWQWVHWKPLVLRGRVLFFWGGFIKICCWSQMLLAYQAAFETDHWYRLGVQMSIDFFREVRWSDLKCPLILLFLGVNIKVNAPYPVDCIENHCFWGGGVILIEGPYKKITAPLPKTMVFNGPSPRRLHWLFLRGPDPKSMHKIGLKAKKSKRICPDTVSVNAKSQCTLARRLHWFFSEVPKSTSIVFFKFQKVHRFWGEVRDMCIDFLGKFLTCASILGRSSWHVHRFSGEVPDMCIDFGVKFVTCASTFWGSSCPESPELVILLGGSIYVIQKK